MDQDGSTAPSPRDQTDRSLRGEREQTDRALSQQLETIEDQADAVVERARVTADAVLEAARTKADRASSVAPRHAAEPREVTALRAAEDEALRVERAAADRTLMKEREESAQALARLLPLERDRTDRYLLTERERSDDALANRDDFLGIVSHDLRNLLGGIVTGASMVEREAGEGDGADRVRLQTQRIQRYAARMNRLVGDLVDVASIEAGKLAVTPARGDVARLIAEAIETLDSAASAKGVTLIAPLAGTPLPAAFDHDRLLQVLLNLLANAIKFTARGGRIEVRAQPQGGTLRVSVGDTGKGIPGDHLEAIFQRFWQAGETERRGLGLGLYISRCIVKAHGGVIWAESTEGEGTTISFTLPSA
jgi:signal transduction histidine kinase